MLRPRIAATHQEQDALSDENRQRPKPRATKVAAWLGYLTGGRAMLPLRGLKRAEAQRGVDDHREGGYYGGFHSYQTATQLKDLRCVRVIASSAS